MFFVCCFEPVCESKVEPSVEIKTKKVDQFEIKVDKI